MVQGHSPSLEPFSQLDGLQRTRAHWSTLFALCGQKAAGKTSQARKKTAKPWFPEAWVAETSFFKWTGCPSFQFIQLIYT